MEKEKFIELYNRYNADEIDKLEQLTQDTYTGEELYDFCEFILRNSRLYEKQKEQGFTLKPDMWVYIPNNHLLIYLKEVNGYEAIAYGFDKTGDWREGSLFGLDNCIPAPLELVKTRLANHVESVGLVRGTEVRCLLYNLIRELKGVPQHSPEIDRVISGGHFVMEDIDGMYTLVLDHQGVWAKPLTESESAANRLQGTVDKVKGSIKIKIDIYED